MLESKSKHLLYVSTIGRLLSDQFQITKRIRGSNRLADSSQLFTSRQNHQTVAWKKSLLNTFGEVSL